MLGRRVACSFCVEEDGAAEGNDLLPVENELSANKNTLQSRGQSILGSPISGYEIHMGRTVHTKRLAPFLTKDDGTVDGAVLGRIAGTYFHGLFDNPEFTTKFVSLVAENRQLTWRPEGFHYSKQAE